MKDWFKIKEVAHEAYDAKSQIEFKTKILNSILCYCNDAYIVVKGTVAVVGKRAEVTAIIADKNKKQVIF